MELGKRLLISPTAFLQAAIVFSVLFAHDARAQDIGMAIFNSANSAAINIAGTNAMNAAIASQYDQDSGPSTPQEPYRWGTSKKRAQAPVAPAVEIDTSPPAALDFRPDAEVTRTVNARFADLLGSLQPDKRDQIAAELDSGALQAKFAQLLASYGYSSRNLADVMTAYLIIAWEVVHNQDATRYINGIGTVHVSMRKALSRSPSVRDLSDAQKQELAETLGNLTMLAAVAKNALVQRGDTDNLALLQENVRTTTQKFGVDLASVQLTDQGFVPQ